MAAFPKIVISSAILIGTLVLIVLIYQSGDPADSGESPRFRAGVYFVQLSESQLAVEEYVKNNKTLAGSALAVNFEKTGFGEDAVQLVTPDGKLAVIDTQLNISILLTPEIVNGGVIWHCNVIPKNVSPVFCGGGSNVLPNKALKDAP